MPWSLDPRNVVRTEKGRIAGLEVRKIRRTSVCLTAAAASSPSSSVNDSSSTHSSSLPDAPRSSRLIFQHASVDGNSSRAIQLGGASHKMAKGCSCAGLLLLDPKSGHDPQIVNVRRETRYETSSFCTQKIRSANRITINRTGDTRLGDSHGSAAAMCHWVSAALRYMHMLISDATQ